MSDDELRHWAEQRIGSPYPSVADVARAVIALLDRKSADAVKFGSRGGRKGGPARAAKMTAEERSAAARHAARARWNKLRNNPS